MALGKVKQMATLINERKKMEENEKYLNKLQAQFGPSCNIFQPHRQFLKNGRAQVICQRKELVAHCTLYIFNDCILMQPDDKRKHETIFFAFANMEVLTSDEFQNKGLL